MGVGGDSVTGGVPAQPQDWLCEVTHPGKPCPTEFDTFPELRKALWILLGGGLDDAGKEQWLAWRLERNYSTLAIFHDAIVQIDGMVAT